MDFLTILGLGIGLGVVYYVMLQGEITALLFNFNAFLLVFGGTFASAMITYPWSVFRRVPKAVLFIFKPPKNESVFRVIDILVNLQNMAYTAGIDALAEEIDNIGDEFMRNGVRMLIEDLSAEEISDNMSNELMATRHRHQQIISVFRSMGSYAPIFGLLGTLIGVVQVLRNLSDPTAMGASMAIAITTTFYGIFGSNFLFLPIAGKLEGYSSDEMLTKELVVVGILSIKEKVMPILLKHKLERFISERGREKLSSKTVAEE